MFDRRIASRQRRKRLGKPIQRFLAATCMSLVDADGVQAGLTRFLETDAPVPWTSSAREVFMVLEGSVRIEIEGGAVLELGVGDMATLPKGLPTTWHVTAPFKEMWVIA